MCYAAAKWAKWHRLQICKHLQTYANSRSSLCSSQMRSIYYLYFQLWQKAFCQFGIFGDHDTSDAFHIAPQVIYRSISAGIERQLSRREFCCHGRFTGRAKTHENDFSAMRMYPLRSIIPSSMQFIFNVFKIFYITSTARSAFKYLELTVVLSTVHCTARKTKPWTDLHVCPFWCLGGKARRRWGFQRRHQSIDSYSILQLPIHELVPPGHKF